MYFLGVRNETIVLEKSERVLGFLLAYFQDAEMFEQPAHLVFLLKWETAGVVDNVDTGRVHSHGV
jgi:hypothetical protein